MYNQDIFDAKEKQEKRKAVFRKVLYFFWGAAFLYFAVQMGMFFFQVRGLDKQIESQKEINEAITARKDSIDGVIERFKSDTLFLETMAREKMGLTREGERVYRFIDE